MTSTFEKLLNFTPFKRFDTGCVEKANCHPGDPSGGSFAVSVFSQHATGFIQWVS